MAKDKREGERRMSVYRGVVLIILGIGLPIAAAVRGNDFGTEELVLTGICFAGGAFFLGWSLWP
jgi:hypothetical protein